MDLWKWAGGMHRSSAQLLGISLWVFYPARDIRGSLRLLRGPQEHFIQREDKRLSGSDRMPLWILWGISGTGPGELLSPEECSSLSVRLIFGF